MRRLKRTKLRDASRWIPSVRPVSVTCCPHWSQRNSSAAALSAREYWFQMQADHCGPRILFGCTETNLSFIWERIKNAKFIPLLTNLCLSLCRTLIVCIKTHCTSSQSLIKAGRWNQNKTHPLKRSSSRAENNQTQVLLLQGALLVYYPQCKLSHASSHELICFCAAILLIVCKLACHSVQFNYV